MKRCPVSHAVYGMSGSTCSRAAPLVVPRLPCAASPSCAPDRSAPETTWRRAGARFHHQWYTVPPRTHPSHPLTPRDDCLRLRHVSQVVGDRWCMVTILFSGRRWRATDGATAGQAPRTNAAGERRPGAPRPCDRCRVAQQRRSVQCALPDATLLSGLMRAHIEKLAT